MPIIFKNPLGIKPTLSKFLLILAHNLLNIEFDNQDILKYGHEIISTISFCSNYCEIFYKLFCFLHIFDIISNIFCILSHNLGNI